MDMHLADDGRTVCTDTMLGQTDRTSNSKSGPGKFGLGINIPILSQENVFGGNNFGC